jgi:tight adherence protein B
MPQALDSLAAGLSAGLSLHQAVDYACEELPSPISGVFARLSWRLNLGSPLRQAMQAEQRRRENEPLAMIAEGLILQQRYGGDLIRMLENTAAILRERIELEREVHAVTTQGRFSGWVIAALMPVSAGLLFTFNPHYAEVLLKTTLGQVLIVLALSLQFIGWAVISRLIRVRY